MLIRFRCVQVHVFIFDWGSRHPWPKSLDVSFKTDDIPTKKKPQNFAVTTKTGSSPDKKKNLEEKDPPFSPNALARVFAESE